MKKTDDDWRDELAALKRGVRGLAAYMGVPCPKTGDARAWGDVVDSILDEIKERRDVRMEQVNKLAVKLGLEPAKEGERGWGGEDLFDMLGKVEKHIGMRDAQTNRYLGTLLKLAKGAPNFDPEPDWGKLRGAIEALVEEKNRLRDQQDAPTNFVRKEMLEQLQSDFNELHDWWTKVVEEMGLNATAHVGDVVMRIRSIKGKGDANKVAGAKARARANAAEYVRRHSKGRRLLRGIGMFGDFLHGAGRAISTLSDMTQDALDELEKPHV